MLQQFAIFCNMMLYFAIFCNISQSISHRVRSVGGHENCPRGAHGPHRCSRAAAVFLRRPKFDLAMGRKTLPRCGHGPRKMLRTGADSNDSTEARAGFIFVPPLALGVRKNLKTLPQPPGKVPRALARVVHLPGCPGKEIFWKYAESVRKSTAAQFRTGLQFSVFVFLGGSLRDYPLGMQHRDSFPTLPCRHQDFRKASHDVSQMLASHCTGL